MPSPAVFAMRQAIIKSPRTRSPRPAAFPNDVMMGASAQDDISMATLAGKPRCGQVEFPQGSVAAFAPWCAIAIYDTLRNIRTPCRASFQKHTIRNGLKAESTDAGRSRGFLTLTIFPFDMAQGKPFDTAPLGLSSGRRQGKPASAENPSPSSCRRRMRTARSISGTRYS